MKRLAFSLSLILAFAGCVELREARAPEPKAAASESAVVPATRSEESLEIETFYARVEAGLLSRGLLRSDGGGPDTPFTDEMLTRNFLAIAFSEEFSEVGGLISASPRASTLHRWTTPVRIEIVFGNTVAEEDAERDRAQTRAYAERLSRITGHPIAVDNGTGNFTVFFVHDQTLRTLGPELAFRLPEISEAEVAFVQDLPLDAYCIVLTSDPGNTGEISRAVAIIRAELPPGLKTACIHEDVAQGLGLANDSDLARPSVFKDDDEFGRLTTHDEMLLSILYDDRLTPGMTETEAAPIVRQIARALKQPRT